MTDVFGLRRLQVELDAVPMAEPRRDWDTPQGEHFLRDVMAAVAAGDDVDTIGEQLGIERLRYIVKAREKYLRGW